MADSTPKLVRQLADLPDADRYIQRTLPWVHEAGNPYFDWLFGGAAAAHAVLNAWMSRPSSEVSVRRISILMSPTDASGGFLALSGDELARARRADTLATLKEQVPGLRDRLAAARGLFSPVEPDEFYLSKIGVALEFRSTGMGRKLIQEYLDSGRSAGFRRFRLNVSADNDRAVALYRAAGFGVDARKRRAGMTYLAMTLDL